MRPRKQKQDEIEGQPDRPETNGQPDTETPEGQPQSLEQEQKKQGAYTTDADARQSRCTIILGTNGTGKSTLTRKIIDRIKGRSVIVIDFEGFERTWRSFPTINPTPKTLTALGKKARKVKIILAQYDRIEVLNNLYKYAHNCIIVFDDCRLYLKANTDEHIEKILIRRRQRMFDLFFVAHGFTEVPPRVYTFTSHLILFRTEDSVSRRRENLKDYPKALEAQKNVNQIAKKDGPNPHYCEEVVFDA
jgi:energy-coupling factor transporter ATP-binding protein EcfA2